ncbi:MAG: glycosyltransferase family 2 protein [Dehalococcoidia bacterium]|nr:glycosyltransferase family 2 protein [Dehalococcoidia bacterium]
MAHNQTQPYEMTVRECQPMDPIFGSTMPKIVCMMRVKNEERWIVPTLTAASPIVAGFVILDDNSTDRTPELCRAFPKVIRFERQTESKLDEARDKDRLLQWTLDEKPDWILALDGDEVFENVAPTAIAREIAICPHEVTALAFNFLYMWDSHDRYRVDGKYGELYHTRLFKISGLNQDSRSLRFRRTTYGGNLHCGSIPGNLSGLVQYIDVNVKHYGYFERSMRAAKRVFYERTDPVHASQGYYDHLSDEQGMVLMPWQERDATEVAYSDGGDRRLVRIPIKLSSPLWRFRFFVSLLKGGSSIKRMFMRVIGGNFRQNGRKASFRAAPGSEKGGQ